MTSWIATFVTRRLGTASAVAIGLAVLLAAGSGRSGLEAADRGGAASQDTVVIELRIWQHVDAARIVWLSARPSGGRWDTLGTIPFPLDRLAGASSLESLHYYADLTIAGVGLRVSQRHLEPERFFVQVCAESCPERFPQDQVLWRPLGMNPLSLDDGISRSGRYRYGDLDVAVPRGNPGLLADREHLLALRDVIEGDGADLDWSVGRATVRWEGVKVGGAPQRVIGLDLSGYGLDGELWGYIGDLAELAELRLDGNSLAGRLPSKLALLKELTALRLGGNFFEGCVPPPLWDVPDHDLQSLALPDCAAPILIGNPSLGDAEYGRGSWEPVETGGAGTYWAYIESWGWWSDSTTLFVVVVDVPAEESVQFEFFTAADQDDRSKPIANILEAHVPGLALRDADDGEAWLFLDGRTGAEGARQPYSGCVYDCESARSRASLVEQLAASAWVNPAIAEGGTWVWP